MVCAIYHTMILTEKGEVWATGRNNKGQLGIGNNGDQNVWVKSFTKEKVINIACGEYHTIILTEKGEVWATGFNKYEQLGIGNYENQNKWIKRNKKSL